jgi:hypothetical protein
MNRFRLRQAPRLMAACLALGNRVQRKSPRDAAIGIGVILLWVVLAALLLECPPESLAAVFDWMHGYWPVPGGLAGWFAAVLVTGKRASKRTEALRSWLAALPVPPRIARWESFCLVMLPAVLVICCVTLAFAAVLPAAAVHPGFAGGALLATWLAVTATYCRRRRRKNYHPGRDMCRIGAWRAPHCRNRPCLHLDSGPFGACLRPPARNTWHAPRWSCCC